MHKNTLLLFNNTTWYRDYINSSSKCKSIVFKSLPNITSLLIIYQLPKKHLPKFVSNRYIFCSENILPIYTKTASIFNENKQVDNRTVSYNDFAQDITGKDFDDLNKAPRDQIICFLMQKNTSAPKKQMPISLHNTGRTHLQERTWPKRTNQKYWIWHLQISEKKSNLTDK